MADTTITMDDYIDGLSENTSPTVDSKLIIKEIGTSPEILKIIDYLSSRLIPVGSTVPYVGATAPVGWFLLNGETIGDASSGADHASDVLENLFDLLNISGWGNPGGAVWTDHDTVKLPDLRGMFLRGTGTHGSLTMADTNPFAGPSVGSSENDQMQGHCHTGTGDAGATGNTYFMVGGSAAARTATTDDAIVADSTNGTPRTGDETRPVAYGINYIIKY